MADTRKTGDLVAGKYRLEELIGEGGFGVVWSATQLGVERRVAIKFVKRGLADDDMLRRFRREARALARLQHPGCVTLIDFGTDEGLYLVTEFIQGEQLDEWSALPRTTAEKLRVGVGLLDALAHAHERKIVHRDLKPANIFVCEGFDGWTVKVLDFGISSVVGAKRGSITKTGDVFGTPGYMSPEQLKGFPTGPQADLYACGVIFYELFEGAKLFPSDSSIQLMMRHMTEPAPRLSDVDEGLADFVARLLEKEPLPRYSNAGEALGALRHATAAPKPLPVRRQTPAPPAAPSPTVEPEAPPNNRRAFVVAAGLIAAVAISAVVVGYLLSNHTPEASLQRPPAMTQDTTPPEPVTGCASPPSAQPGMQTRLGTDVAYLPSGYAPTVKHPMLVVHLPQTAEYPPAMSSEAFDREVSALLAAPLLLRSFADEQGWIVWMRNGPPTVATVDDARRQLCIDEDNVMLLNIDPTEAWEANGAPAWSGKVRGAIRVVPPRVGVTSSSDRVPSMILFPFPTRPTSVMLPRHFKAFHRTKDVLCAQLGGMPGGGCLAYPADISPVTSVLNVFDDAQEVQPTVEEIVVGEPTYFVNGCGAKPLEPGLARLEATHDYEEDTWRYVPPTLDSSKPHALIVLPGRRARWLGMTGAAPKPSKLREQFDAYRLHEVADRLNAMVVFSPTDTFDVAHAAAVRRATCWDPTQTWAIGIPPTPTPSPEREWPYWADLPVTAMATIDGEQVAPRGVPTLRVMAGEAMVDEVTEFLETER